MLKTIIKIAVVLLLIKELWLLLQIPSVADAVFSFVMIGQVPGTDTTLSPDQMMWLLIGVFVVVASLIFRKELMSLFRSLLRRNRLPGEQQAPEPVAPVVAVVEKAPAKKKETRSAGRLLARLSLVAASAKHKLSSALARLGPLLTRARVQAGNIAAKGFALVRKAAIYAWKIALVMYILVSALAIAGWQWLRPRFEKFDRWLDKKLHQNEYTAAVLAIGGDMQRAMSKRWADFKAVDDPKSPQE
jgi:hypothetical protein